MYSRSSVLMTSTMKSEPGRSTTLSPGSIFSLFLGDWAPACAGVAACSAALSAAATVVAAATADAAVVFRNILRSTPDFFSSAIQFSSRARRKFGSKSLTLRIGSGTPFHIQEPFAGTSMQTKIMPLSEAVERTVKDGQTLAMEGFTHLIPFAAGHEIIRQGRRNLTLVRMTPDILYDQLIGMGCATRVVFSWGGNPGVGSIHRFRDAIENGWPHALAIEEHSHADMAGRYQAGASGLPFSVLRGFGGSDLPA